MAALGAYLDAKLAGANEFDADDIAKVMAARPPPTYEERLAVFRDFVNSLDLPELPDDPGAKDEPGAQDKPGGRPGRG